MEPLVVPVWYAEYAVSNHIVFHILKRIYIATARYVNMIRLLIWRQEIW